ncbi:MAG: TIGR04372 family glycosyltransferase [Candidatus Aminicenantaceae bacterium]
MILKVRVLRPIIHVQFGALISERIGHFAGNTELYLCKRDAGLEGKRTFDIFYHTGPICNQQLKKMWDRVLHVSNFGFHLDLHNRRLPGWEKHVIEWAYNADRDIHGLLARMPMHLSFTPGEERQGNSALRELGIPEGAPFVCFIARDPAYLDVLFPSKNWNYHDYRDSNIHKYIPGVEELARRDYFAVRMGAVVRDELATSNPKIIDYATKARTDFMDIFLSAHCYFFISDTNGLTGIPMIFRRPIAWVNCVPLELVPTWGNYDLIIPKKLWLRENRRFLTFREILDSDIGRFSRSEQYEQAGIDVVENTPEEITALVVEMDERLKGSWQTTEEDEELQQRFWSLFKPSELHGTIVSRIGAEFLRQNQKLLD